RLHIDEPPAGDGLDAVDLGPGRAACRTRCSAVSAVHSGNVFRADVLPELPDAADAQVLRLGIARHRRGLAASRAVRVSGAVGYGETASGARVLAGATRAD